MTFEVAVVVMMMVHKFGIEKGVVAENCICRLVASWQEFEVMVTRRYVERCRHTEECAR